MTAQNSFDFAATREERDARTQATIPEVDAFEAGEARAFQNRTARTLRRRAFVIRSSGRMFQVRTVSKSGALKVVNDNGATNDHMTAEQIFRELFDRNTIRECTADEYRALDSIVSAALGS